MNTQFITMETTSMAPIVTAQPRTIFFRKQSQYHVIPTVVHLVCQGPRPRFKLCHECRLTFFSRLTSVYITYCTVHYKIWVLARL